MHDLVFESRNLVSHTANRYFHAFRRSLNSLGAFLRLYFGISGARENLERKTVRRGYAYRYFRASMRDNSKSEGSDFLVKL